VNKFYKSSLARELEVKSHWSGLPLKWSQTGLESVEVLCINWDGSGRVKHWSCSHKGDGAVIQLILSGLGQLGAADSAMPNRRIAESAFGAANSAPSTRRWNISAHAQLDAADSARDISQLRSHTSETYGERETRNQIH